jgi:hypothetical protein
MEKLEEAILKAVDKYNKYRSPEARARLIEIWEGGLTIDFEGSFCWTCGVYDYFEDFIYELQELVDLSIEVLSFREYEPGKIRVKYRFKTD